MQYAHTVCLCAIRETGVLNVNAALREQIQSACDDVHHDPNDRDAFDRLGRLLGAEVSDVVVGAAIPEENWRSLVRTACDELFDDPENRDARVRLLLLMAARVPDRGVPTNPA